MCHMGVADGLLEFECSDSSTRLHEAGKQVVMRILYLEGGTLGLYYICYKLKEKVCCVHVAHTNW